MIASGFRVITLVCLLVSTTSLAGETCTELKKQNEDKFYRAFTAALKGYRLNDGDIHKCKETLIALRKAASQIGRAPETAHETSTLFESLAKQASQLIVAVYPRGNRVSKSTLLSTITLMDKDLSKPVGMKVEAMYRDLAADYVRNGLDPCTKAVKALQRFSDKLSKKVRRKRDPAKLRQEIEDVLDEIDVAFAKYEIMMKDKRAKAAVVEELMFSINKVCNSNPNPEVRQPGTKRYWLRCPLGQNWNGSKCLGTPKAMDWETAKEACPAGFRLPTREELIDILGHCDEKVRSGGWGSCCKCKDSKPCSRLFPSDKGWYWSSSPVDKNTAWRTDFGGGYMAWGLGLDVNHVRCIAIGP